MIAYGLAAGRIAIGAGLWAAPRLSMGALGFRDPSPETIAIARVAGTRDLILGAWQLSAIGDDEQLARASAAVAACDAGDAVAFGLLYAAGNRAAGVRGLAAAVPATVAGALLVRSLRG